MPIFMNLTSTQGETANSIEIDSFSFGMVNSSTIGSSSGGAGAGKVTFHEITVTKRTDSSSSPLLLQRSENGNLLPAVQFVFTKGGFQKGNEVTYLQYNLKEVLVSSIQWSSGGDRPTESISLAFEQFEVQYLDDRNGGVTSEIIKTGGNFFYPTG